MTIVCYVESQHLSMMQEMADELKDCLLPLLTGEPCLCVCVP